ncbi:MAG: MSCRAMM family adhesin SdrC, partial [Acidimicrobiia bacterium]|nr:MSCRAMM family adhesin SdrC [Acidimicrobiia bacterium]
MRSPRAHRRTSQIATLGLVVAMVIPAGVERYASAVASTGESCPSGSLAYDFFWQRADGSGAQWPAVSANWQTTTTNTGYNLTYPVGASGVDLTVTITDPANRSEDQDNPLTPNSATVPNWDTPVGTRTNGAYGIDYLTIAMNSANSNEELTFDFQFTAPVLIPEFDIGDIDYTGQNASGNDPVHDSFQDEVELFAKRGAGDVSFTMTQGSPGTNQPVITGTNSVAGGPFNPNLNGNLTPTNLAGTVYLSALAPITSFGLVYSNGPGDAANDPPASGLPGVPNGSVGVSNNHAIRISGFTVCVGTLSIGDTVFADIDGDGDHDPGEPGIAGVEVELRDTTGNLMGTTTTDANGTYTFTDLPPNLDYVVDPDESTLPSGTWTPTGDAYPSDTTEDGVSTVTLTPTSGSVSTADFAYQPDPILLSGTVYSDPENDATVGARDTPLTGVTVELLDGEGSVIDTTTTDSNGDYTFSVGLPGSYTIRETQPATYADGAEVPGTNGATSSTDDEIDVTLDWSETSVDNDFFEVPGASVAGTVYL